MKTILGALVVLSIWIIAYAFADFVFEIEKNSWAMIWGYVAGSAAFFIGDLIDP